MDEIKNSITVDAPVKLGWDVITDFANYEKWNQFFPKMTLRDPMPGSQENFWETVYLWDGVYIPCPMKVVNVEAYREFSFATRTPWPISLAFTDYHVFTFEETAPEQFVFTHRYLASGTLFQLAFGRAFIKNKIRRQQAFMNRDFKRVVERKVADSEQRANPFSPFPNAA